MTTSYTIQGIRSAYRLYKSNLGYQVRAFDVTTSWVGTRNLIYYGIDPYSTQGKARIEEAFFGRPLEPEDDSCIKDKHSFVYPLYEIFLYLPTVFMKFPDALLVIWMLGFLMLVFGVLLLLRIVDVDYEAENFGIVAFFLSWPHIYIALQSRQPLIFVFFLIVLALYIILFSHKAAMHEIAGMLLFMSTIKPQSSLLGVIYILLIWLPSMRYPQRMWRVWFGFTFMAIVCLMGTLWLVPGWIGEFLQALIQYRDYAGSTGAESLWGKGTLSVSLSGLFIGLGVLISIISYKAKQHDLHLIVFAYWLVLQGIIFPAHSYVMIMGIPVVVLTIQRGLFVLSERKRFRFYVILVAFLVMTYTVYKYWLAILSEAEFAESLSGLILKIVGLLPNIKLPMLVILAFILCLDWIWDHPAFIKSPKSRP